MKPLPPRFLNKRYRKITVLEAVVLLTNMFNGAKHKNVGFEDSNNTMDDFITRLGKRRMWIEESMLESALWSCNLMDENQKFWHPKGYTFDQFVQGALPPQVRFNKKYNFIEEKD